MHETAAEFRHLIRPFAILAAGACRVARYLPFIGGQPFASPLLIGNWTTTDHNTVSFRADAVVVTPDKGSATTIGPRDCNGRYKLLYGRMDSASLLQAFPSQKDLQGKLKQFLVKPDYQVADVTCDQGGTTYLMLDDARMLAVYRDSGVGGLEAVSRASDRDSAMEARLKSGIQVKALVRRCDLGGQSVSRSRRGAIPMPAPSS